MEEDMLPAFAGKEWALKESEKLPRMESALTFAVQEKPEGYGHAFYQTRKFVEDKPFLLLLGDHVYVSRNADACARQLVDAFHKTQAQAFSAVQPTPADRIHLFGVIQGVSLPESERLYQVAAIKEKPAVDYASRNLVTSGLASGLFLCQFGMHVFPPVLFDLLERQIRDDIRENGEFQLTSAQDEMRKHLAHYSCLDVNGDRYDTGVPFGLMEAQIALALSGVHRRELARSILRVLERELQL
jgi:UTP--glucose-1-phosphate uridylyltransferase